MTTTCLAVLVDRWNVARARAGIERLLQRADVGVVLVIPSDDLPSVAWALELASLRRDAVRIRDVDSGPRRGDAVRQGLAAALEGAPRIVGYIWDGFATPAGEVLRLLDAMQTRPCAVLLGARVAMLGTDIRRSILRHYLGRGFAMLASTVLCVDIYDTQCGVKLFRPTPALAAALARPFVSRIAFDVELLSRLLAGEPGVPPATEREIVEVPLQAWDGVAGAPVRARDVTAALADLVQLRFSGHRHRVGRFS